MVSLGLMFDGFARAFKNLCHLSLMGITQVGLQVLDTQNLCHPSKGLGGPFSIYKRRLLLKTPAFQDIPTSASNLHEYVVFYLSLGKQILKTYYLCKTSTIHCCEKGHLRSPDLKENFENYQKNTN